jgi:hypothetical protein
MTETYLAQQQRAADLIRRKGGEITIKRQGAQTGDAWNPTVAADVEYTAVIVETGFTIQRNPDSLIRNGDKLGVMAVSEDYVPRIADNMVIGGLNYRIVSVAPIQPNPEGEVVIYQWQARQ